MIPFEVNVNGQRVGITFESLFWFFVVTVLATVVGGVAYYYLQPYLPSLPAAATPPTTPAPGTTS